VDLSLVLRRPPTCPSDRLPAERLDDLCAALRQHGLTVRDDPAAREKLAELRALYEPFAAALSGYFSLALPDIHPHHDGRPDNWQTSAWMRRAFGFGALSADPRDDHFD
jgi:hypothetical protein